LVWHTADSNYVMDENNLLYLSETRVPQLNRFIDVQLMIGLIRYEPQFTAYEYDVALLHAVGLRVACNSILVQAMPA